VAKNAKYAAFFMQGIFIQHEGGIFRRMAGHCRKAFRLQRQLKHVPERENQFSDYDMRKDFRRLSITRWLFVKSEEFIDASI
jgi:hypothetical protein